MVQPDESAIRDATLEFKAPAWAIVSMGLFAVLMGCVVVVPAESPDPPPLVVAAKIPLKVALVIPESTRAFSHTTDLPGPCIGGAIHFTAYGVVLEQSAKDIFSSLFEEVTVVRESLQAVQAEAILEVTMTKFGSKFACRISPYFTLMPEGTFRAIDRRGTEVWRSQTISNPFTREVQFTFRGPNSGGLSWEEKERQDVSSSIANLVTTWAQEISKVPIAQYAQGFLPGQSPRPESPAITPTTIVPPPIY
jgi:hypothetical protein